MPGPREVVMLKLVGRCYVKVPNEACNCCLITVKYGFIQVAESLVSGEDV